MCALLRILTTVLQGLDPNGMELRFTTSRSYLKSNNISQLVRKNQTHIRTLKMRSTRRSNRMKPDFNKATCVLLLSRFSPTETGWMAIQKLFCFDCKHCSENFACNVCNSAFSLFVLAMSKRAWNAWICSMKCINRLIYQCVSLCPSLDNWRQRCHEQVHRRHGAL